MIDAIDLKILEELKEDSRKSYSDIAEVVGKTNATIRRRIKKMIKKNIINKFTIEYDIDNQPKVHATVKIEPNFKEIKRIINYLREIEEITNIWRLSGDCGFLIKLEIPSIEAFNPLIEGKISQIDSIKIIETCFITDIIK
ncbi:MAG: Lrp/AsnC family transcriptional regulator [Candidatus Heimdallarchaeota archaeon]